MTTISAAQPARPPAARRTARRKRATSEAAWSRGRHALEDEDGDPDEHRGGEDEARHLADVVASSEHHEQRTAVHEHLVGDRDHRSRPGERDRGADVERLPLAVARERREHAAADDDGHQDARHRCCDHRRGREIPRRDGKQR